MSIHKYFVFCSVVQKGSFTNAAQHLLISQPSVSATISALEKELGVFLIERNKSRKNTIILTEAGEKVYDTATKILKQLDSLDLYLSQFRKLETRHPIVTIITNSPIGSYLLPELLYELKKIKPQFKVDIFMELNYISLVDAIKKGLYDIAILPEPPNDVSLDFVFQEPLILVANKQFYSKHYSFKLGDLPLVLPLRNSSVRLILDRYFMEKGIKPNVIFELSHPESIKKIVKLGKGVAILSLLGVTDDIEQGELVELKIADDLPIVTYSVVHHINNPLKEPVQHVLDVLDVLEFLKKKLT